jgi:hypothetical protein
MSRGKSEIRMSNVETNWSKIQNREAMSHNENSHGKLEGYQARLLDEAEELMKIFGAIARKSQQ